MPVHPELPGHWAVMAEWEVRPPSVRFSWPTEAAEAVEARFRALRERVGVVEARAVREL